MDYTNEEIEGIWDEFFREKYYMHVLKVQDTGAQSLEIDMGDIYEYCSDFAESIINNPDRVLEIGEIVLYNNYHLRVKLRPTHVPNHRHLRNIDSHDIGRLFSLKVIVRQTSDVKARIVLGAFKCSDCGGISYVEQNRDENKIILPDKCEICGKMRGRVRFKLIKEDSAVVNYRAIAVQDLPEDVGGKEQPTKKKAELWGDIVFDVKPGDRLIINAVVRGETEKTQGGANKPTMNLYLDVLNIERDEKELESTSLTQEDIDEIKKFAASKDVIEEFKKAIAPTIYGMDIVKEALVLQMFGGVKKTFPDGSSIRGDIHVLLVGDPGTAKSQLLTWISQLVPRSIYTSGKGSSAAGLTASVTKDPSGQWALEAGALVLADGGHAVIDEIDKMSPTDRDSIYQAMEQQVVTVAKAGINAMLYSRCSVLAAANPKYGRFDPQTPLASQINLPLPLLSRFDVLFKIMDTPIEEKDRRMAEHIGSVHQLGTLLANGKDAKETGIFNAVSPEFIRKYVAYARESTMPEISDEAKNIITNTFLKYRKESREGAVAITPRQLEAMYRLAEASARARLSNTVEKEDAERAVKILTVSLSDVATEDGVLDIDLIYSGTSAKTRRLDVAITRFIREYALENMGEGPMFEEIVNYVMAEYPDKTRDEIENAISTLRSRGIIIKRVGGKYIVAD